MEGIWTIIYHSGDCEPIRLTVFLHLAVAWDMRNFSVRSQKSCLLFSSWEHKYWLVSRMLISVLGPEKVVRDTAMLKLMVEEVEPKPAEKKPKQIIY